jgi:hypothetical protein
LTPVWEGNEGEFINDQLFRWCEANQVTFTRTDPYRKNDNSFVEQNNFPVVRQQVGCASLRHHRRARGPHGAQRASAIVRELR